MTEGGCNYFKLIQADKVWQEQLENAASTANFVASIRNIDEDHQLWQAQITVFSKRSYDRHAKGSTSDVYLLVQRGDDQKWDLDRVLVGPGIER